MNGIIGRQRAPTHATRRLPEAGVRLFGPGLKLQGRARRPRASCSFGLLGLLRLLRTRSLKLDVLPARCTAGARPVCWGYSRRSQRLACGACGAIGSTGEAAPDSRGLPPRAPVHARPAPPPISGPTSSNSMMPTSIVRTERPDRAHLRDPTRTLPPRASAREGGKRGVERERREPARACESVTKLTQALPSSKAV